MTSLHIQLPPKKQQSLDSSLMVASPTYETSTILTQCKAICTGRIQSIQFLCIPKLKSSSSKNSSNLKPGHTTKYTTTIAQVIMSSQGIGDDGAAASGKSPFLS